MEERHYLLRVTPLRPGVSLPDEDASALVRAARRRGLSVSALVRKAVEQFLAPASGASLPFAALGRSGHRTTARDAEEILTREWTRDRNR